MKKLILVTSGLILGITASPAAPLQINEPPPSGDRAGCFIGVDPGVFWLQSLSASSGALGVNLKFSTGWGVTVPFGYDFGNGLKVFASAGYYKANISDLTGYDDGQSQSVQHSGGASFVPLMANASYAIKLADRVRWQIGAGLGAVRGETSFASYDFSGTTSIIFGQFPGRQYGTFGGLSDTQWGFAFTAFTGLEFELSPHSTLHVGYRFLHVNESFSFNGGSSGDFNGQAVEAGVTFIF